SRIIHFPVFIPSIMKSSGNTDGTNGIQPICILNNFQFLRNKYLASDTRSKRHIPDNICDMRYQFLIKSQIFKKITGNLWSQIFISFMKFTVGYIMKQSG